MVIFTSRMTYGVNAVLFLAESYGKERIRIKDIADRLSIPQHYLEQILVILKKAGIVRSYRGMQGGYVLALHPEELTIARVLKELAGPIEDPARTINGSYQLFWNNTVKNIEAHLDQSIAKVIHTLRSHSAMGNFII